MLSTRLLALVQCAEHAAKTNEPTAETTIEKLAEYISGGLSAFTADVEELVSRLMTAVGV